MPYIGNNLQVAFESYKAIDDISSSFNGSTTAFNLLVGGVAPTPSVSYTHLTLPTSDLV